MLKFSRQLRIYQIKRRRSTNIVRDGRRYTKWQVCISVWGSSNIIIYIFWNKNVMDLLLCMCFFRGRPWHSLCWQFRHVSCFLIIWQQTIWSFLERRELVGVSLLACHVTHSSIGTCVCTVHECKVSEGIDKLLLQALQRQL